MTPKPDDPNQSLTASLPSHHAAPAPFNHESADLVLRSTDGIDFKVHKGVMAIASPFFNDMLELGEKADAPLPIDYEHRSIISMLQEDSRILEKLLRFCYPISDPVLKTLDELQPILGAAVKYQFEEVIVALRKKLASFIENESSRVFAIACRYSLEEEVRVAAVHAIQNLPGPYVDEFRHIPASALHRLWDLQRRGAGTVGALAANFESWMSSNPAINPHWVFLSCTYCAQAPDGIIQVEGQDRRPRTWWRDHMRQVESALRQNPLGKTVRSASVMWPTLSALAHGNCTNCVQATALDDLEAFNTVFVSEVNRVLYEIAESIRFT